jgi:hypothetical protein
MVACLFRWDQDFDAALTTLFFQPVPEGFDLPVSPRICGERALRIALDHLQE